MHDIRAIREDPQAFDAALARRGITPIAERIVKLDEGSRRAITDAEVKRAEHKRLSTTIGIARRQPDPDTYLSRLINVGTLGEIEAQSQRLKMEIGTAQVSADSFADAWRSELEAMPNLPAPDVPDGADEVANVFVHERGVRRNFGFNPGEHFEFGPALGLDFESAQAVSGARFAYLRGPIARLSRALGQFMLDVHTTEFGYEEVAPPLLVRDDALFGTAQLPKFATDLFQTAVGRWYNPDDAGKVIETPQEQVKLGRWLIPTAEVSLTNLVRDRILAQGELPLRFTALTPCFRSEAGAAGRDTRGLIRQHQFDKVELVSITTPDASEAEHERMTQAAETVLDRLALPYRRMLLCAGDMGFAAKKTYDLEVWLPGQDRYREISSCSNCGDFQARRMAARYRVVGEKGTQFVHTLNGSGVAVGRALVAVLENYQQENGGVAIPDALIPYMGGVTRLDP